MSLCHAHPGKVLRLRPDVLQHRYDSILVEGLASLADTRVMDRDGLALEREVKRANRDLSNLLSNIESPLSRLDVVQKKYTDLLADMRRLEREYGKSKKRAEQLQKDRDVSKTELSKMVSMKEKMEKLSRELQKEKQKLKVSTDSPAMTTRCLCHC